MNTCRQWISYMSPYREEQDEETRAKNIGFVKVDLRNGRCRMKCCVRDTGAALQESLQIGLYAESQQEKRILVVGELLLQGGVGERQLETKRDNLFGHRLPIEEITGLCLITQDGTIRYESRWREEKPEEEEQAEVAITAVPDVLPEEVQTPPHKKIQVIDVNRRERPGCRGSIRNQRCEDTASALEQLPEPDLWQSLCCYYPQILPEWHEKGIELLQIRPADIRYLPQRLWHFGSNSFLLHGYYQYRHLILGQIVEEDEKKYILGVQGTRERREAFSAELFGFREFLPVGDSGQGYWYTRIAL